MASQQFGRYRIEGALGEGAMANVYRACDPEIGRTVAIKVLKPEFARDERLVARFLREARAAGALSHAHIATIYDVGQADGLPYIAMELVDGRPLDEVLAAEGRLPYERVLHLARQLADALAYAHRAGIVHRDVKPSNILVARDGRTVKLLDFGVARVAEADGAALARTQAGQMMGTPRYMSPEQALGLPVDRRSDLFSLGVVLYEMITGKVAFPGTGLATLAIQIAQERVQPISADARDCPSGLRFVIDKLLAKKPDRRFDTGEALVAALEREIAALEERGSARRGGIPLRFKLPLVMGLMTGLALLAAINFLWDRQSRALEQMAIASGNGIAQFVTSNAGVTMADNAGLPPGEQDWTALRAFVQAATRNEDVAAIVIADESGTVRAASDAKLLGKPFAATPGTVRAGEDLRIVRPVLYAGAPFGTVEVALHRGALDAALATSRRLLMVLSAAIMLVVLGAAYLSGAMVSRPLRRLRSALEDAASGGFGLRISHRRRDEFGRTFDAFNRAAAAADEQPQPDSARREAAVLATRIAA